MAAPVRIPKSPTSVLSTTFVLKHLILSKFDVILTVHRRQYVEIKCQLDATEVFYCRSSCLLNMFRAPLCPSSGAQEYCTVVAACGIWCCGFQVVDLVWS
jgi:hypothetical protein